MVLEGVSLQIDHFFRVGATIANLYGFQTAQ